MRLVKAESKEDLVSMTSTTLERRIGRIERMNRLLLAVVATTLLLLVLMGAKGADDTVQARALQLIDADRVVRAELAFKDGHPGLFLKDEDGLDRLLALHEPEATGLYVADKSGTTRIGVAQFAHGGGGVALHGPGSKGAAVLYFKEGASLRFYDRDGKVVGELIEPFQSSE